MGLGSMNAGSHCSIIAASIVESILNKGSFCGSQIISVVDGVELSVVFGGARGIPLSAIANAVAIIL
jgi:hypothetical protein